jgi:hypothetical protein
METSGQVLYQCNRMLKYNTCIIIKIYDLSVPVSKVKIMALFLGDKCTEQTYMNIFNLIIFQNSYHVKL